MIGSKLLDWFTRAPPGASLAERRMYPIARFGLPMGLAVHALYAGLFFHIGQTVLGWYNLAILPIWAYAVWAAVTLRSMKLALVLAAMIETTIHALLATLYMGLQPFFLSYMLFTVILPPLFAYWTRATRIAISMTAAVLMTAFGAFAVASEPWQPLSTGWNLFFFIQNFGAAIVFVGMMMALLDYAIRTAEAGLTREFDRAEGLLRNILPDPVAARLKDSPEVIAEEHAEVSVLFADIVGFTRTSATLPPAGLVAMLDGLFRRFDTLAERHGCEKIKTIGDAYMAATGLPEARADHARAAVALALDMLGAVEEFTRATGTPLAVRVGINSGPVVAGVIGRRKFAYDLWGDTVNVAARMEEIGAPGAVWITAQTRAALGREFDCRPLGAVTIRGKGEVEAFEVTR
ncbi:adenylate/guanylate cyclase domain-containing protein [Seohaeicola zhoushanensis]|uniref:Guanylate cyclase domain-containing protein n=1 Tax=Seohaeicola zhoushanensis TaxID=1569283 RepID=A0A8J3M860_9RHOB|nr:adenylate/guanylate cyclase domain-containing protein [Seohaeicola zhoushanensis]GHF57084.1 hypothetical protein GCM10017056_30650 [Seohaeicola zhoushanensis]